MTPKPPKSVWAVQDRDGTWFPMLHPAFYRENGHVVVRYDLHRPARKAKAKGRSSRRKGGA